MASSVLGRAWGRFREWRRTRPFWSGVFLVLAGLIIVFPPFATLQLGEMAISIQTIGGLSGALIGTLLIICALTMWVRPQFRLAAGITALLLALVALVTTNLGGFLLGTLFGLLGSALAISWTRKPRKRRAVKAVPPAAAALFILAVLTTHGFATPSVARADSAPAGSVSATTSTTAPATSSSAPPTSTSSTTTTTAPTSTTSTSKTTTTSVSPPQVPAGTRAWTLTATKLSMNGLSFGGVVSTVLSGKPLNVLKFTASTLNIDNLVQTADLGNGHKIVTSAAPGSTSTVTTSGGKITLLTAELKGDLDILGIKIPVDYTAAAPPPLTIPGVTFVNVTVTNTDLDGGVLTIPGAKIIAS